MSSNPANEVANLTRLLNTPNLAALPVRVVIQGQIQVEAQGPTPIERVTVVLTPKVTQDLLQSAPQSWWVNSASLFSAARNGWLVVDVQEVPPPTPSLPSTSSEFIPQPANAQIGDLLVYNGTAWVLLAVGNAGDVLTSNGPGFLPTYQPGGGGGGGETSNVATYSCAPIVAVGDVVYLSASNTVAKASASTSFAAIGVVQSKPDPNTADVVLSGQTLAIFGLLVAGTEYFLSTTAGALTTVPPISGGTFVQKIGTAQSTTQLVVNIAQPIFN